MARAAPQAASKFATGLATAEDGTLIDVDQVVIIFMLVNAVGCVTDFLLKVLKGEKSDEGYLQTRLFEINLKGGFPKVADTILAGKMFTHYDRPKIAQLCEKCGLYEHALDHYSKLDDIKRVTLNSRAIDEEFLINFFGRLSTENGLACIDAMLDHNSHQNLAVVVKIATKYTEEMTAEALIALFEKFNSIDGLYSCLGAVVNSSQETNVHFKYIEATAKLGHFEEVERACRDSTVYNAKQVKEFLMDAKLTDPHPLIHVCSRYDFVEDLIACLYCNNLFKYIDKYVQKCPGKTPMVI
jgi:clathrin heavy chain